MPSLSIVKTDLGKGIKWGAIIIGILIILFIAIKFLLFVKELIFPTAPPPPTVAYGKLLKPYFPEGIKKDFTYEIDTISGELPVFPLTLRVYEMEQRGPDLLAVERISKKLTELNFRNRPQQISDFVYKWTNPTTPQQDLILNIKLSEFNLSSPFMEYESSLKGKNFSSSSEPIGAAQNFLKTLDFYPEDIDEEKTRVEFKTLENKNLTPTTRVVNSNVADVYFFQKSKDDLPIVYPQGPNSSMKLTIAAGSLMGRVIDAKFSHQKILEGSETYPIKTAQEAYEELKKGNAYVPSYSGNDNKVLIKNVYPALYYEGTVQKYLTPVIVFEGNNGFLAYVFAIKDEWIDK